MSGESDSLTPPPAEPQALTFHDVKRWAPESRDQRVAEPKCTRSVRTALAFSDYKAVHPVGPDSDRLPVAMKIAETEQYCKVKPRLTGGRCCHTPTNIHKQTHTRVLPCKHSHMH